MTLPGPDLTDLAHPDGSVRLAALRAAAPVVGRWPEEAQRAWASEAARRVREDEAPLVRRSALLLLGALTPPRWRDLLVAFSDPVWRVRVAAVRLLSRLGEGDEGFRDEVLGALRGVAAEATSEEAASRVSGARVALAAAWGRREEATARVSPSAQARRSPWWDDDPAVRLARVRRADARGHLASLLPWLGLDDGVQLNDVLQATRGAVIEAVLTRGEAEDDARVIALLAEPRAPFVVYWVGQFLDRLPEARREALRRRVLGDPGAPERARGWAQTGTLVGRGVSYFAPRAVDDRERATAAVQKPGRAVARRALGEGGPRVGRLGLSGRYGLPAEGYAEAVEAGVDLLFWEPTYEAMGCFVASLPGGRRAELTLVAGTFEASAWAVRRELEQSLRLLRGERIEVFMLFWARSPGRLDDDVVDTLERLRDAGKIGRWGVSTHDRALGEEALARGAQVLMLRYSAAHRGAEARLLPAIAAHGAGALAFSCLCYGKLLEAEPSGRCPEAPELYGFALAHPAITACLTAPRTLDELRSNLRALDAGTLPEERLAELRRHGDEVYRQNRLFFDRIRDR